MRKKQQRREGEYEAREVLSRFYSRVQQSKKKNKIK